MAIDNSPFYNFIVDVAIKISIYNGNVWLPEGTLNVDDALLVRQGSLHQPGGKLQHVRLHTRPASMLRADPNDAAIPWPCEPNWIWSRSLAQSEMEKHGHRFDLGLRTSSRLNCINPQSCWLKQTFLKIISIHVQTINLYICLWIKSSFLLLSPKFGVWKDIFFLNTFLFYNPHMMGELACN